LGKFPFSASCSAICQPSDVSPYFKAVKKYLLKIPEKDYQSKKMETQLSEAFHDRSYSSEKKKQHIDALMRILYAKKNVYKPELIKAGYRDAGCFPLDFSRAMGQCTLELTPQEYSTMENSVPTLVELYRTKGFIMEKDFDELNIKNVNHIYKHSLDKDELPLHRQRSVVITAKDSIAKFKARKDLKEFLKEHNEFMSRRTKERSF
jgi:hypothetical protein